MNEPNETTLDMWAKELEKARARFKKYGLMDENGKLIKGDDGKFLVQPEIVAKVLLGRME